jgi:hypothetical protein
VTGCICRIDENFQGVCALAGIASEKTHHSIIEGRRSRAPSVACVSVVCRDTKRFNTRVAVGMRAQRMVCTDTLVVSFKQ